MSTIPVPEPKIPQYTIKETELKTLKIPQLVHVYRFVRDLMLGSHTKYILAGGAIRNYLREGRYGKDRPKDYDFFISTRLTSHQIEKLKLYGQVIVKDTEYQGFHVIHFIPGKEVLSGKRIDQTPIQFIFDKSIETNNVQFIDHKDLIKYVLDRFDWNINQCAFDGNTIYEYKVIDGLDDVMYLGNPGQSAISALYRGLEYKNQYGMFIEHDSMRRLGKFMYDIIKL